jgi:hypothetical protein
VAIQHGGDARARLLRKLDEVGLPFGQICKSFFQGPQTGAAPVYVLDRREVDEAAGLVTVYSPARQGTLTLESAVAKRLVKGSLDARRYWIEEAGHCLVFPYRGDRLIPPEEFAERYPLCWAYLLENRERLESRAGGKMRHAGWYGYLYPNDVASLEQAKLLTPSIARHASFSFDGFGHHYLAGGGGGYGIVLKEYDLKISLDWAYVLALLNSRLLDFYLHSISQPSRAGWHTYHRRYLERLPIRCLNLEDFPALGYHGRIALSVMASIHLQKRLACAGARDKDLRGDLAGRIARMDAEIDALVYEVYELTEEEIALVERETHR